MAFNPRQKRAHEPLSARDVSASDSLNLASASEEETVQAGGAEWVVVARLGAAYGIKGWVKLHPFSHSPDALLHVLAAKGAWYVAPFVPNQAVADAAWQKITPQALKPHSDAWVMVAQGWTDRTAAERFVGWQVALRRSDFPKLAADEFYWADLLGAQVINQEGVVLGEIVQLLENTAQTIMQIESLPSDSSQNSTARAQYLIPFVSAFVGEVDLQSNPKTVQVDWDVDALA